MDNQIAEPIESRDEAEAVDAFKSLLSPQDETEQEKEQQEQEQEETTEEEEAPEQEANAITVEVGGKMVTLTPEQVAEAYKNGLRQADYTRKTQEVSEEKKQALQERNAYAEKLNTYAQQLQYVLNEQEQTNWTELLETDPVEYLKQQHLYQQRQAALQQAKNETEKIAQARMVEEQAQLQEYLAEQNSKLLEAIPTWKDESKRKSEMAEIRTYLKGMNYSDEDIAQVTDHRHVVLLRNAMQFEKLLKEAPTATKRVQQAPPKAERSGAVQDTNKDAKAQAIKAFKRDPSNERAALNAFSKLI